MATYEIGDTSARVIWQALHYYRHEDNGDPDTVSKLLDLFAPPQPPTAAELAEALRGLVNCPDYRGVRTHERARALSLLTRWEASQP